MRDVLRSVRHVLAIDAFANTLTLFFLQTYRSKNIHVVDNKYQPRIGETVEFIYDPNSGAEAMRIGYDLLRQGKRVAFVSTGAVIARALVEKASKLSKPDNSPVRVLLITEIWMENNVKETFLILMSLGVNLIA